MLKRLFDITFSFLGLTISALILIFFAILVKLGSPGPVFHRGLRVGKHGKVFKIYKFRSMVADAEKLGGPSSPDDDPRVTKSCII